MGKGESLVMCYRYDIIMKAITVPLLYIVFLYSFDVCEATELCANFLNWTAHQLLLMNHTRGRRVGGGPYNSYVCDSWKYWGGGGQHCTNEYFHFWCFTLFSNIGILSLEDSSMIYVTVGDLPFFSKGEEKGWLLPVPWMETNITARMSTFLLPLCQIS